MTECIITLIGSLIFIVGGIVYFRVEDKRYWKNYWIEFKKRDDENSERFLREAEEYVSRQSKLK